MWRPNLHLLERAKDVVGKYEQVLFHTDCSLADTYVVLRSKEYLSNYVCRDSSLVGLVQHDAGVGRHLRVDQGFSEQHSVRHVLDDRLVAEKQTW